MYLGLTKEVVVINLNLKLKTMKIATQNNKYKLKVPMKNILRKKGSIILVILFFVIKCSLFFIKFVFFLK
ncbi:hypothetical protein C0J52_17651 [Blattella germanica]|nr:hypothetical protein C0J52_17651 [Blattella germanica]